MRTYKKRIITDVVSVGMLLLAVGLILLMHRYMGDVKSIYLPEAKTTGMPFNIGFRWSVILGMIGVILIQVVMYVWTYCNKNWKLFTWATGIWIYSAIVFEYVSSSSKLGFFFILRDNLQYSNPDIIYSVWAKANMLVYAILFVIGLIYLSKWLFGTNEKSPTTPKVRKFVPVIFIILVPAPSIFAPILFKQFAKSTISGSIAAFVILVVPSANVAAKIIFSVAPTLGKSKLISALIILSHLHVINP